LFVDASKKYKDKIDIEKDYDATDPIIKGNFGKLHQALVNLISNAIDAIDENGTIKIITNLLGDKVSISIVDDGLGIPNEILSKVRDHFFTTKPPGKGTGLGLSIVHSIIQEHNGNFEISSEPGKGTTVEINLPIK
jgi:signal transduction histidine kinase